MSIKYKNNNNQFISFHQTDGLEEYYKVYFEDDVIIKEACYLDSEWYGLTFYNHKDEAHKEIIHREFIPLQLDLEYSIVDTIFYKNGCRLEKTYIYGGIEMEYKGKTHSLFDWNGMMIGHEVFFGDSPKADTQYISKTYFDKAINPYGTLCEFRYHSDTGKLTYFSLNTAPTSPFGEENFFVSNTLEELWQLKKQIGMPDELVNYYAVAEVIPRFDTI